MYVHVGSNHLDTDICLRRSVESWGWAVPICIQKVLTCFELYCTTPINVKKQIQLFSSYQMLSWGWGPFPWRLSSIFSRIWKECLALQDCTYKCFKAILADSQLLKVIFCRCCLFENCLDFNWIRPTNVTTQVDPISC